MTAVSCATTATAFAQIASRSCDFSLKINHLRCFRLASRLTIFFKNVDNFNFSASTLNELLSHFAFFASSVFFETLPHWSENGWMKRQRMEDNGECIHSEVCFINLASLKTCDSICLVPHSWEKLQKAEKFVLSMLIRSLNASMGKIKQTSHRFVKYNRFLAYLMGTN